MRPANDAYHLESEAPAKFHAPVVSDLYECFSMPMLGDQALEILGKVLSNRSLWAAEIDHVDFRTSNCGCSDNLAVPIKFMNRP